MTTLDESKFKNLKITRGFKYHHFAQSLDSNSSLPTILFLHGFQTSPGISSTRLRTPPSLDVEGLFPTFWGMEAPTNLPIRSRTV
jgi:hypothetical protein